MDYVNLGPSGLKVSRLCLGTMALGDPKWQPWVRGEAETVPILKKAVDIGINFFDMANWYSAGGNEELVGRSLLKLFRRDELVLATKVFYPQGDGPNDSGLSRKHVISALDNSLKRMGTDYVDLYIIHSFDAESPIEETLETLHDSIRAGKIRYIGASTMFAWQFAILNMTARRHGWTEFVNMQCQYNLLYREEETEMLPYCRNEGIAVSAWSPLARGFLTGIKDSLRAKTDGLMNWYGSETDVAITARVVDLAKRRGVTPGEIALSWVLGSPYITTPVIGADHPDQLDTAAKAAEIALDEQDRRYLEELYQRRQMINEPAKSLRRRGS